MSEILKIRSNFIFKKIASDFFLRDRLFRLLKIKKTLETIRYNKSIQKRIGVNINHYKAYSEEYSSIELDIIPMKVEYSKFINIEEEDKKYFHIYFNNNKKKEIERTYLDKYDNVSIISITIDYQVKSFKNLFFMCHAAQKIKFKKFYRNNVTDMSGMFSDCSSLISLDLSNFNTDNVTDMSDMFYVCSSLKELNLSNFNTKNVTNMSGMFSGCKSLKELNLNNFDTNNGMFIIKRIKY